MPTDIRLAQLRRDLAARGVPPVVVKEFERAVRDDERQAFVEKLKRYL